VLVRSGAAAFPHRIPPSGSTRQPIARAKDIRNAWKRSERGLTLRFAGSTRGFLQFRNQGDEAQSGAVTGFVNPQEHESS